jgi:hypothetical protein
MKRLNTATPEVGISKLSTFGAISAGTTTANVEADGFFISSEVLSGVLIVSFNLLLSCKMSWCCLSSSAFIFGGSSGSSYLQRIYSEWNDRNTVQLHNHSDKLADQLQHNNASCWAHTQRHNWSY